MIYRYLTFHFALAITLMLPLPALAIPAITCHCFTERSYNQTKPAAADPYFLATTQNSFFAIAFTFDKKNIVLKKQSGTSSDDLWIAYWIASKSSLTAENLLETKQHNETWKETLARLRPVTKGLGSRFLKALNAQQSTARLAELVVDDVLFRYRLQNDGELAALRKSGATSQECILAAIIAAKSGQPARQMYLEVKGGVKTWGFFLEAAGINTKNMQMEIAAILKNSSDGVKSLPANKD